MVVESEFVVVNMPGFYEDMVVLGGREPAESHVKVGEHASTLGADHHFVLELLQLGPQLSSLQVSCYLVLYVMLLGE